MKDDDDIIINSTKEEGATRLQPIDSQDRLAVFLWPNGARQVWYWCVGCESHHALCIQGFPHLPRRGGGPQWSFNGSRIAPTLGPSVKSWYPWGDPPKNYCCHHYVKDGRIEFLNDCTHKYAGQTLDLPRIGETLPDSPNNP